MEDHYKWLKTNLPKFFSDLKLSTAYCEALIIADGDKCYTKEKFFDENGIHFYHGCALYLLSKVPPYRNEVRETETGWVDPFDWIVNNKGRFAKYLPEINDYIKEEKIDQILFYFPQTKNVKLIGDKSSDLLIYYNELVKLETNTADELDKEHIRGEISGIRIALHKLGIKIDGIEGY